MGFGIALASGFVRELNQIEKEKRAAESKIAADAAEDNRFRMQEMFKSSLQAGRDTASAAREREAANVASVAEALQQGIKDQTLTPEGIAAIGTGATKLLPEWFDLSKSAAALDEIQNTFNYGNTKFRKPTAKWDEDLRGDNPKRAGDSWLRFFDGIFADEEKSTAFINDLKADENALNHFLGDLERFQNYYIDGQLKKPNTDPALISGFLAPEAAFKTLYGTLKSAGILKKGSEEAADTATKLAAAEAGSIDNPETAVIFKFTSPDGVSQRETFDMTTAQYDSLGRIAAVAGYGNNVQGFIDNFTDTSRAPTGEEAYGLLLDAVDFEIAGYGVFDKTGGGNTQLRVQLGRDLEEKYGNDPYPAIQALATILTVDEDRKAQAASRKGYVYTMKPPEDYFQKNKLNKQQIIDQYAASEQTISQLEQLDSLIAEDETPTGLKAKIQSVGFGIFGEGGQLGQFFASENTRGYEEGTTVESLTEIAINRGFLSAETAKNLSVIDALKLSLAAQMARAVDPSGRLSNQDFEIQLQRLGQTGLFTSKVQARASLSVVIEDFKRTRRRLQILNEVATADSFGLREARLLKADRIARMASNELYIAQRSGLPPAQPPSAGEEEAKKPVGRLTLDSGLGVYFDDNNQAFRDAEGTQPLTPKEVLEMLGGESR